MDYASFVCVYHAFIVRVSCLVKLPVRHLKIASNLTSQVKSYLQNFGNAMVCYEPKYLKLFFLSHTVYPISSNCSCLYYLTSI